MFDTMRIIKSMVEESGLLIKRVRETIKNEAKLRKRLILGMLLSTLGASLLILLRGESTIRAGEGTIRASKDSQCCLIL